MYTCSTKKVCVFFFFKHLLQKHVDYLKKVLLQNVVKINDYPSKTVEKITRS